MGNYRFKLSDMMSNAWFYKLKEIGTKNRNHIPKKQPTNPNQPGNFPSYPRKTYYISRELNNSPNFPHDPPRKSSRRPHKRTGRAGRSSPKLVTSSVSAGCSCRATLWTKSDSPPDSSSSLNSDSSLESDSDPFPSEFRSDPGLMTESFNKMVSLSQSKMSDSSSSSYALHSSGNEFVTVKKPDSLLVFDAISDLNLAPIVTKPVNFSETEPRAIRRTMSKYKETNTHTSVSVKIVKEEKVINTKEHKNNASYAKKHTTNTPGVRLRLNSPRIATRKFNQGRKSLSSTRSSRRSLSDSLAVVKASYDPQRDFRDSMMEMIVENNIRASKDLEDLLACYLSLNSDEYHDLIIKVFKQIWFDLTNLK